MEYRQIHHAAQHPVELDRAQAAAVEARITLDLKVGAAFTRMQTQILQNRLGQLADGKHVVSYGKFFQSLQADFAQLNAKLTTRSLPISYPWFRGPEVEPCEELRV